MHIANCSWSMELIAVLKASSLIGKRYLGFGSERHKSNEMVLMTASPTFQDVFQFSEIDYLGSVRGFPISLLIPSRSNFLVV